MPLSKNALREVLSQSFLSASVKIRFFEDEGGINLWNTVLDQLPYVPTNYLVSNLLYQASYMRCFLRERQDVSVILFDRDVPIGIFPLTINYREDGDIVICTNEGAVYAPLYSSSASEKVIRRYDRACLTAVDALCAHLEKTNGRAAIHWQAQISFLASDLYGQMMIWHRLLLERGGTPALSHELYVDLSLPLDDIHMRIRKSYRSLIHKGDMLWKVEVHTDVTSELFTEFRLLHREVAGRATRSVETWDAQERAVHLGEAFLITLRSSADELIGAALYAVSKHEATYAVAAYRRDLFDQPVSHVAHWHAIQHMKKCGIKWYHIGPRVYPGDLHPPTEKELSIAYFKEGFSTHMFFNVIVGL